MLTGDGLFSDTSASYKLTLYSSDEFKEVYRTKNPRVATIGAVLAIFGTSLFFVLYGYLVDRDLLLKRQLFIAGWNHRKRYEQGGAH